MYTHNLDPVLFNLGILEIRWYSLAYIVGILIGWWLGRRTIIKNFKTLISILILKNLTIY